MVYPEGLKGCLVPVITSLPKSLAHGMNVLDDEPTFLQVELSQFMTEECESKAPIPGSDSTSTSPTCPVMALPLKAESQVSMTMEVTELLSWAVLDTSSQALGSSTPKRPVSAALGAPSSLRAEDSANLVDTSSQVSPWADAPEDVEPSNQTLEEIYAPPSPPVKTPGPGACTLPEDVIQLQKEVNRALGHLLMTRSSLDTHWRKPVSDFEMALHQNESETTEAIKEAKVLCHSTIREAEAH